MDYLSTSTTPVTSFPTSFTQFPTTDVTNITATNITISPISIPQSVHSNVSSSPGILYQTFTADSEFNATTLLLLQQLWINTTLKITTQLPPYPHFPPSKINFLPPHLFSEWNLTAYHRHHQKLFNETPTYYHYSMCPSIQMPVGNIISMILYAIVCIIGLFGNTLVIYVVLRFSKMQTVTNMYILNLAIADECFLIGIPFLITTMYLGGWTLGKGMCKIYMVSTSITQFTSSIFLFIMSADRYIAVCHPISSTRYRSPFVSQMVSACAWTASALIMLPVMLYANTIDKNDKSGQVSCIIEWPHDHEEGSGTTFTLYSLILGFAIPLSMILIFYYLVLRKLQTVGPKTKSKEKKRSHRKVTKMVLTVITVYILCWLPYWISQVALINSPPDICQSRLEVTIFVLVGCLGYSNSAMNPILYAFLSDNFKKSFLKACTCAGKDFNAQLQIENSLFPKFGGGGGGGGGGGVVGKRGSSEKATSNRHGGATGTGGGGGKTGGIGGGGCDVITRDGDELGDENNQINSKIIRHGDGDCGDGDGTEFLMTNLNNLGLSKELHSSNSRIGGEVSIGEITSESIITKSITPATSSVYYYKNSNESSSSIVINERPPVLHTDL